MIPKLNRGFSFKGLTAYLTHDKGEPGEARPATADRVGFIATLNFLGEGPRGATEAAREMALTWICREDIKQAAGIKPGGSAAKAPPVWHSSLAWAKGETPDRAEKMRAVESYLKAQGLGLDRGYQTVLVEHTDTAHPHVHIVVNLVHPATGKQADPYRDRQKAQAWGRDYEKARGQIHCRDREAKYAALDRERAGESAIRAAFTEAAKGGPQRQTRRGDPDHNPNPDRFGRDRSKAREPRQPRDRTARPNTPQPPKGKSREQWQASTQAATAAERQAAEALKARLDGQYHAMRTAHGAAWQRRQADYARQREDHQAARSAIYEKYAAAFDALYGKEAAPQASGPDRSQAWERVRQYQAAGKRVFEHNEQSALGRVRNALLLAKGGSLFRAARLAVSADARRQAFERKQRQIARTHGPVRQDPYQRTTAATPSPKHVRAAQPKAMRAAELSAHDRQSRAAAASMSARHQFERQGELARKAGFAASKTAAWTQHRAAWPHPEKGGQERPAANRETKPADRYGRSRDRQPRQRDEDRPAEAENLPVEAADQSGAGNITENPEATRQPAQEQDSGYFRPVTPEEAAQLAAMEEARNSHREADRQQDYDLGQ